MSFFGENWDCGEYPLAYLITIRTYGTWLHGDEKSSIDQHGIYNLNGSPRRPADLNLKKRMKENMVSEPFSLNEKQRVVVHQAIEEVCEY